MLRTRVVLVLVMVGIIGACWLAQAISQQADTERQGRGEHADRQRDRSGDRSQRMEEFRKRMEQRMREQLGASEEEWKALQPGIEKVQQVMRQTRGGFGRRTGRSDRRPEDAQRPEAGQERERSEVEKKTEALRSLLGDKASGADAIKAALDALRQAREKAQQELAAARKDLRSIVTVRQEAQLVLMGILD